MFDPSFVLRRCALGTAMALAAAQVGAATNATSVQQLTTAANATGVQFGFWENQRYQYQTFHTMGKRPTARVAIDGWDSIERKSKGVYDWSNFDANSLASMKMTHQYGETIFASVNVSFTSLIAGKNTIPAFYKNDITNAETRAAALNFVKAYVMHLAGSIGSHVLTIDYEIMGNYRLNYRDPGEVCNAADWWQCRDDRASTWAAWYVEAVAAARSAVAAYNSNHPAAPVTVKFQPILNGDPTDPANALNSGNNAWFASVVKASDTVAVDTYHCAEGSLVTDASSTVNVLKNWAQRVAAIDKAKKLVVAENGFSSGLAGPGPTRCTVNNATQGKYKGLPNEQRDYYNSLFPKLMAELRQGGSLRGKVSSFNFWSIVDNERKDVGDTDHYFGVVGLPQVYGDFGAAKPATAAVVAGLKSFEAGSDTTLRPTIAVGTPIDVRATLAASKPVALTYTDGVSQSFLRFVGAKKTTPVSCTFNVAMSGAVDGDTVLLRVNETDWLSKTVAAGATTASVALTAAQCAPANRPNVTVDVYLTGYYYPTTKNVTGLTLQ